MEKRRHNMDKIPEGKCGDRSRADCSSPLVDA